MRIRHLFSILVLLLTILSSCSRFQSTLRSKDFDEKYAIAMEYYEEGDFYKAGLILESLLPLVAGRKEAEDIRYYHAYCQYYQEYFQLSSYYFNRFVELYPRSVRAQEAYFRYAESLFNQSPKYNLDQSATKEAIDAVQTFLNIYPTSEFREQGEGYLQALFNKLEKKEYETTKLYVKTRRYKAAVIAVESFRKNYPESQFNEELAYLKIVAQYELAKISVERIYKDGDLIYLKERRYQETIDFYERFISKYADSKYASEAETIFRQANTKLKILKNS